MWVIVRICLLGVLQGLLCEGGNVTTIDYTNQVHLKSSSTVFIEVKSCSEVYIRFVDTMTEQEFQLVMKPDSTHSSYLMQYQFCRHNLNCITYSKVNVRGSFCNEFAPHWINFGSNILTIGRGCTVGAQQALVIAKEPLTTFPFSISISSKLIATWKYGDTACQPETTTTTTTTTATTTTTTKSPTTTTTVQAMMSSHDGVHHGKTTHASHSSCACVTYHLITWVVMFLIHVFIIVFVSRTLFILVQINTLMLGKRNKCVDEDYIQVVHE